MVAFVVFWSATFAIIFFALGIIFKALASAFNALLTSIGGLIAIGGLTGLATLVLYLLYAIIDGIIKEGFWSVVGNVIFIVIVFGIIIGIIGGLGTVILEIAAAIASFLLTVVSVVLEWAADLCERAYAKFLKAIIGRLDKY